MRTKKEDKKSLKLNKNGGLKSRDDDDTASDLVKESDDSIDSGSDNDDETENISENIEEEEDSDDDKLDGNQDIDDEDKHDTESSDSEETNGEDENYNNKKCAYNLVIKKKEIDDSDDELYVEDIGEKNAYTHNIKKFYIPRHEYTGKKILTKYERVRVLSVRTSNLASGAKPMIENIKGLSERQIARLELKNKKMPFIIKREYPDGSIEVWDVNDLKIIN